MPTVAAVPSKPVALLWADLGVTKTHSRPQIRTDTPASEAPCKTLQCRPDFPERLGSIEPARGFCQPFFHGDNTDHRHFGIGMLTPKRVHSGHAMRVLEARAHTLPAAFEVHPERLQGKKPKPVPLPEAAWINRPLEALQEKRVAPLQ